MSNVRFHIDRGHVAHDAGELAAALGVPALLRGCCQGMHEGMLVRPT